MSAAAARNWRGKPNGKWQVRVSLSKHTFYVLDKLGSIQRTGFKTVAEALSWIRNYTGTDPRFL